MKRIYNEKLKKFARELRKNSTPAEILLWRDVLKARKMKGYQFNRQFPIGNYIVDFICRKLKLVIEVDGFSHDLRFGKHIKKDEYLRKTGYTVLHVKEKDILKDIETVKKYIESYVEKLEKKN